MVFQEPQSSLNPSMRCGPQVMERLQKFEKGDKKTNIDKVINSFNQVQLLDPREFLRLTPMSLVGDKNKGL